MHYDLAARSSLHGSGGNAGEGSAAPGPKSPRWSAERRARPAGRAPRLARRGRSRVTSATTENLRLSALRSPLMGADGKERSKTRAQQRAAGTKKTALFDIVNRNIAATRSVPAERAPAAPCQYGERVVVLDPASRGVYPRAARNADPGARPGHESGARSESSTYAFG